MSYIKRGFFFVVVFKLLFIFSFCILLYSHQQKKIDELSNQFYSNNHAVFSDSDFQKWLNIPLTDVSYRLFIEYNETFRFFLQNEEDWSPPMEQGRFFLSNEVGNKAAVGREMQDHIVVEDGLNYIEFQGTRYEVIGIIGESFLSHVDYLVLLSSQQFPEIPEAKVVIDSNEHQNVRKVTEYMRNVHESVIEVGQSNRGVIKSASTDLFSKFFIANSILLVIFSTTFYLRYWYEQEKNKINLHFILGIPKYVTIKSILKEILINISIASIISIIIFLIANPQFIVESYLQVIGVQISIIIFSVVLLISFLWTDYFFKKGNGALFNEL